MEISEAEDSGVEIVKIFSEGQVRLSCLCQGGPCALATGEHHANVGCGTHVAVSEELDRCWGSLFGHGLETDFRGSGDRRRLGGTNTKG